MSPVLLQLAPGYDKHFFSFEGIPVIDIDVKNFAHNKYNESWLRVNLFPIRSGTQKCTEAL